MNIFKTFKPLNETILKCVDYYYLDVKPDNVTTEYEFFPHYNNTVSVYRSHTKNEEAVTYDASAESLQIFTPLRTGVMRVRQQGPLHRVVIVFNIAGIKSFYPDLDVAVLTTRHEFFTREETCKLFNTVDTDVLTELLDGFLQNRFTNPANNVIEAAIGYITQYPDCSVEMLSAQLNVSTKHLNRLFNRYTGTSVKKFKTVYLFRKVLEAKLKSNDTSFTSLAHEYNFFDQAHLIKTFKSLTHNAPKDFFSKGTLFGKGRLFWNFIR